LADSTNRTHPVELGRRWHNTTFRWLSVYAVIFALSVMVLIGFIGWSATTRMEFDADSVLHWQLFYFGSIDDPELPATIHRRTEGEHLNTNYFGLFAADGTHLAGDIRVLPSDLPLDRQGHTLNSSLTLANQAKSPVVRAMGIRRQSGEQIVVARDLTQVLHVRETMINALVGGGLLCLLVSIASGLLLNLRQMRRVRDIRNVTLRIAEGDLNRRLPIGGRDELDMLAHLVNHMLEEIERLMTEVKSACDGIAHDLRTPAAHIRTLLANVAERMHVIQDDGVAQMLDRARVEADMLLDRFGAMLRISEIGALKRRGGFSSVDLTTLVNELSELYEPLAEDRGISWAVVVEQVPTVHGDRALLFEAFSNLLDNAIKFAPDNGAVRIELTDHPQGAVLVISDNGPGIPEREREAVLQRFYRADQTRHLAGSGLGLSIVSAVMRLHDFALRAGANGTGTTPGTTMTVECWPHALE
jgi:signal transduction histidine kinase